MARISSLGAYVAADTPAHGIDARVKLVVLLAMTVAVFAADSAPAFALLVVSLAIVSHLGGVSPGDVMRAVRPTMVVLAFSLLANAFVADGSGDIAIVGSFGISLSGLVRGALAVTRIVILVAFALVASSTTNPPAISDAAASLMRPLGLIGVPVTDIAMILSVAIRFIPICAEELDRIAMAQRARGAHLDDGSLGQRIRAWASVLTPLVVSLFRRADVLADAMRDRCYRGRGRTRLTPGMGPVDVAVLVGGLMLSVICCML